MEAFGGHRVIFKNRQWLVNSRGDVTGRKSAGLAHWFIFRGEAGEDRWTGRLADCDPIVDRALLAKALQAALAQPDRDP